MEQFFGRPMIYYLLMSFEVGTPNLLASSCFIPTIILYLVVSNPNVVSSYPCLSWFVPKALVDLYPYCWSIHTIRKQEQLSDWNNLVIAWHKENMILLKEKPLFYTCDFWTIKVPVSVIFFLSLLSTVILMLMLILTKVSLSLGACTSKWTPC